MFAVHLWPPSRLIASFRMKHNVDNNATFRNFSESLMVFSKIIMITCRSVANRKSTRTGIILAYALFAISLEVIHHQKTNIIEKNGLLMISPRCWVWLCSKSDASLHSLGLRPAIVTTIALGIIRLDAPILSMGWKSAALQFEFKVFVLLW